MLWLVLSMDFSSSTCMYITTTMTASPIIRSPHAHCMQAGHPPKLMSRVMSHPCLSALATVYVAPDRRLLSHEMASRLWLLLVLPVLLQTLRVRPLPSREKLLPPHSERVVLLGSSSGIGRDLALRYAARGARMSV